MRHTVVELGRTDKEKIEELREGARELREKVKKAHLEIEGRLIAAAVSGGVNASDLKHVGLSECGSYIIAAIYHPGENRKQKKENVR